MIALVESRSRRHRAPLLSSTPLSMPRRPDSVSRDGTTVLVPVALEAAEDA